MGKLFHQEFHFTKKFQNSRNHGHLLKHLRSKSHVMQLEGLGKLPAGTFLELEKLGELKL